MKNTLYFDADFNFLLLECEEANSNSIYINLHTSAASDQELNISVGGGAVQTESLASDSDINFLLDGTYWAYNDDTTIYLSNSDGDSEPIAITFPAEIDASAALNQEAPTAFLFKQTEGTSGGSSADKMGVVYYISGRPYTVGTSQLKIAELTFSLQQTTTVLVACTILADITGVTDTATLTIRLRINRSWETFFVPTQTVKNGRYIISFTFPQPDCAPADANIIEIYAEMSEGSAYMGQQQIKASVTAVSMKSSEAWTGEIVCDDTVTAAIIQLLDVGELSDVVQIDFDTPLAITESDTPAAVTIDDITADTLTDAVNVLLEE